eukprot:gene5909-4224_t
MGREEILHESGLSKSERRCLAALREAFPPSSVPKEDTNFQLDLRTYLRFVRATEANTEESKKRLQATLEWRKVAKPYLITAEQISSIFKALTMRVGGRCKAGRPILIMTLAVPNEFDVQDRVNLLVYILEITERKGYEQITWIIDFGEMGKHKRDDRYKESRKKTMEILQQHYPERLGLMLLYRTPWYINLLFPVVRPFLDKRTREKVFKTGGKVEDLAKYVDLDQIPQFMGGTYAVSSIDSLEELPSLMPKEKTSIDDHPMVFTREAALQPTGPSAFDTATDPVPGERMDEVPDALNQPNFWKPYIRHRNSSSLNRAIHNEATEGSPKNKRSVPISLYSHEETAVHIIAMKEKKKEKTYSFEWSIISVYVMKEARVFRELPFDLTTPSCDDLFSSFIRESLVFNNIFFWFSFIFFISVTFFFCLHLHAYPNSTRDHDNFALTMWYWTGALLVPGDQCIKQKGVHTVVLSSMGQKGWGSQRRKDEPIPEPVITDPALLEQERIVKKWGACGEDALRLMQEVQSLILTLSNDLEQSQRELSEIEVEASQLLVYKAEQVSSSTTVTTRKGRKKEAESATTVEAEPSATESAIRGLEEKKRQKVVNALTALFNLPALRETGSNPVSQRLTPASTINHHQPSTGIVPVFLLNHEESITAQQSMTAPLVESHMVTSNEPRRPRDVPTVLWDEMVSLRLRRISSQERLKTIHAELQRQMKRFKILQAMYEMSIYSCRSAKDNLAKATEDWQVHILQQSLKAGSKRGDEEEVLFGLPSHSSLWLVERSGKHCSRLVDSEETGLVDPNSSIYPSGVIQVEKEIERIEFVIFVVMMYPICFERDIQ